jgi:hypothetical protein
MNKFKGSYGKSERGNFEVNGTIPVPHPYCITNKHIEHCDGGILGKEQIERAERNHKAYCGVKGCTLSIVEHREALTIGCRVSKEELKASKELRDELVKYMESILAEANKNGYTDGIGLVDLAKKSEAEREYIEKMRVSVKMELSQHGTQSPYFSITGSVIYPDGGSCSGACHDEILKKRPELADLIALHLCDIDGSPSSAVENGFYFYEEARGIAQFQKDEDRTPENKAKHLKTLQDHLRVSTLELAELLRTLDALTMPELIQRERIMLHVRQNEAQNYERAIESLKEIKEDTTAIENKLAVCKEAIQNSIGTIRRHETAGKDHFKKYVEKQRPRWKQEAEAIIGKYNLQIKKS